MVVAQLCQTMGKCSPNGCVSGRRAKGKFVGVQFDSKSRQERLRTRRILRISTSVTVRRLFSIMLRITGSMSHPSVWSNPAISIAFNPADSRRSLSLGPIRLSASEGPNDFLRGMTSMGLGFRSFFAGPAFVPVRHSGSYLREGYLCLPNEFIDAHAKNSGYQDQLKIQDGPSTCFNLRNNDPGCSPSS